MIPDILFALWFFLPAGVANATPILAMHIPLIRKLDHPMDFGMHFRDQRVFGPHKTLRGLITGMIASTIMLLIQQQLYVDYQWAANLAQQVDYSTLPVLLLGPLFGFGALVGDAIESFFKRQRGIAPGDGWFLFDQTDYIIGGALVTMPFVQISIFQYGWMLLAWLSIHIIASFIGYKLHLKARPI